MVKFCTHLTVPGLAVLPVEVGPVAVLVPPSPFVGEGAVGHGDVIVPVLGGEGSALVVGEGIACKHGDKLACFFGQFSQWLFDQTVLSFD